MIASQTATVAKMASEVAASSKNLCQQRPQKQIKSKFIEDSNLILNLFRKFATGNQQRDRFRRELTKGEFSVRPLSLF